MRIIGIDVGANGGIAIKDSKAAVKVFKIPRDNRTLAKLFEGFKTDNSIIFIEKIQLMKADLNVPGKTFGIAKMLKQYQQIYSLAEVAGYPIVEVHPMTWMSYLKLRQRGEDRGNRKRRLKDHAQALYPEIKATLWNADALLIMHFGRVKLKYDRGWIIGQAKRYNYEMFTEVINFLTNGDDKH